MNKKAIEALIKCGAFGSTGATRKGMLSVLEQAQGAGQKVQQDLEIGQGSIFDGFDWGGGAATTPAARRPRSPRRSTRRSRPRSSSSPSCWRSRRSRSACSSPRTRSSRCARRCASASTARSPSSRERKDKDWVNAGGIITAAKKIRTRSGDHMMFATLDDLEGSVEILVFGKALAEYEGALGVDSVVIVRGRVDHKDADKTCLVVQTVEPFEPTPEEVEQAKAAAADAQGRAGAAARARSATPRACRPRSSTTSRACWRATPASARCCSRCR